MRPAVAHFSALNLFTILRAGVPRMLVSLRACSSERSSSVLARASISPTGSRNACHICRSYRTRGRRELRECGYGLSPSATDRGASRTTAAPLSAISVKYF